MKLRLTSDSLRLRLSPNEVHALRETGRVETTVWLDPEGGPWRYSLELVTAEGGAVVATGNRTLQVRLPRAEAEGWLAGDGPGITLRIPTGGPELDLTVETDLRP